MCMEFVATGWCTVKKSRVDQTSCVDSNGSNWIENDRAGVPPGLVWGKGEER